MHDAHRSAPIVLTPHPVRALLVDRDDDTREMYAEYLRRETYEIDEAADGRQALARALDRRPAIVITETRLLGLDGFDLCRLLRADPLTHTTPILVVTGDAFAPDIQRARDAGATEVLVKPCLPEVLLANMKRLLAISDALRDRSEKVRKAATQVVRAIEERRRRRTLVASHHRRVTDIPPIPPPQLRCPTCDGTLQYEHSYVGGVSAHHSEQWDYFNCPNGCGAFQFRQRTRRLRKVV
jgi:CheY-like chemotaxis protein